MQAVWWQKRIGLTLALVLWTVQAWAVTGGAGSRIWLVDLAVEFFNVVNTIGVPLLILMCLVIAAGSIGLGGFRIGQTLGRVLIACAILVGGITFVAAMVGGGNVSASVLWS